MNNPPVLLLLCVIAVLTAWPTAGSADDPPAWAYPFSSPEAKPSPDDGALRRVPESSESFSAAQIGDRFFSPDWHPDDHPPLPSIVAKGRKPDVSACGFCHRAEGTGGPENADIAGLPFEYILQQMADYKTGARSTAVPGRAPHELMIAGAKAISDAEVRAAAAYFSALEPKRNIKVVESDSVPKTFMAGWVHAKQNSGEREPLGQRIIEVPDQLEPFENRDSRATFTAYVPPLSVARGKDLVEGRVPTKVSVACASCHGQDLRGLGGIPSIAGRSPTYIFRQLYEFQTGVRAGPDAPVMQDRVADLTQSDMIAIAAYLAGLAP